MSRLFRQTELPPPAARGDEEAQKGQATQERREIQGESFRAVFWARLFISRPAILDSGRKLFLFVFCSRLPNDRIFFFNLEVWLSQRNSSYLLACPEEGQNQNEEISERRHQRRRRKSEKRRPTPRPSPKPTRRKRRRPVPRAFGASPSRLWKKSHATKSSKNTSKICSSEHLCTQ